MKGNNYIIYFVHVLGKVNTYIKRAAYIARHELISKRTVAELYRILKNNRIKHNRPHLL